MIKFDVFNRFSGELQFTAEIDCDEKEERSVKLGLAVKWGIKEDANLWDANLRGANLEDANLEDANLRGANLWGANLRGANLWGANLRGANLWGANLRGANLEDANLRDANLWGANLRGANLRGARGNKMQVKSLQIDTYDISYTSEVMQIGCERHPIKDWWKFDDERISRMDGGALEWWKKWKPILKKITKEFPAEETKHQKSEAA